MHNTPLISVIIPCYKQSQFLLDAVKSVISQSYTNWECIIIGSDADSAELFNNKMVDIPKMRFFYQDPQGLANARNYGVTKATGEFIQFLDADDFIAPDKFERQLQAFQLDPDIQISLSNHQYFYNKDNKLKSFEFKKIDGLLDLEEILFGWNKTISLPIHANLFKREIWNADEVPFSYTQWYEDWVFWVNISLKHVKIQFLDENLAYYRVHENNYTRNEKESTSSYLKTMIYICDIIPSQLKKRFIDEGVEYALERYANYQLKIKVFDSAIWKISKIISKPFRFLIPASTLNRFK